MPDIIGRRRPGLAYFYDVLLICQNIITVGWLYLLSLNFLQFFATTNQGYALISHEPLQLETCNKKEKDSS